MNKNLGFKVIKMVWSLLNRSDQINAFILLLMMVLFAIVEVIGIGAVLIFMQLVMEPSRVESSKIWSELFIFFGFVETQSFLIFIGALTLVFIFIRNAVGMCELWRRTLFISHLQNSMQTRLLSSYLDRSIQFFYENNSAILNRNVLQEASRIVSGVLVPMIDIIGNGIVTLAIFLLLLSQEPLLTLAAFTTLSTVYVLNYFVFRGWVERLGETRLTGAEGMYKSAQEAFGAVKETKVLNRESFFINTFKYNCDCYFNSGIKMRLLDGMPRFILELFIFGGVVTLVLFIMLGEGRDITELVSVLSLFGLSVYRAFPKLDSFAKAFFSLKFDQAAALEISDGLVERNDWGSHANSDVRFEFKREINLNNINYRYPKNKENAISDMSITISKNKSVAFVGKTGSGKSTLVDILIGLLEKKDGAFLVDGYEVTENNVRSWQKNIGYVPQNIFLTDNTVAQNIAFAIDEDDINQEAVVRAAKMAHLHDFVLQELNNGYDTMVGERGVRLSGGQRQRIGIARALYRNPSLLVMDEATSALDNITEALVSETIHSLAGEITLIIIAHRLSTVRDCDVIYYLDKGKLVDAGKFSELIERNDGFEEMVKAGNTESYENVL
jgi:ATP-binding cassette, subfamily B, bacterial PglK